MRQRNVKNHNYKMFNCYFGTISAANIENNSIRIDIMNRKLYKININWVHD